MLDEKEMKTERQKKCKEDRKKNKTSQGSNMRKRMMVPAGRREVLSSLSPARNEVNKCPVWPSSAICITLG
jgi:hypothetical protein